MLRAAWAQHHRLLCPRANPGAKALWDLVDRLAAAPVPSPAAAPTETSAGATPAAGATPDTVPSSSAASSASAPQPAWLSSAISPLCVARLLALSTTPEGSDLVSNFAALEYSPPAVASDLAFPEVEGASDLAKKPGGKVGEAGYT